MLSADLEKSASLDGMSKPWKPGHEGSGLRDHLPSHGYPAGIRGNKAREHRMPPRYDRAPNGHADIMLDPESRAQHQFEGASDPRMRRWHMPRHRTPGPAAAKHSRRGMKNNSSFLHPSVADQAIGMGKSKAYPSEYMDKRGSGIPDYAPNHLRSKSRADQQGLGDFYDPEALTTEEESDEDSEAATMASNDSDLPLPQQPEQPKIQVQDDFSTRSIHDPRERSAMRPPLKRPNLAFLSRPGGQYSRHTMSGALQGHQRTKQHQHRSEFRTARRSKGPSSA